VSPPRSGYATSPRGGGAGGPAKPVPRRLLDTLRGLVAALLPLACAAQANNDGAPPPSPAPVGFKFTVEQIEAGRAQFHRTCAQCHGRNMVNAGTTVYDLRKFPLDQPDRFVNSVRNGKGNMPSFKDALSSEQIDVLWAYVGTRGGKEN